MRCERKNQQRHQDHWPEKLEPLHYYHPGCDRRRYWRKGRKSSFVHVDSVKCQLDMQLGIVRRELGMAVTGAVQ